MNQADYRSVLDTMRLADGTLFPMPITLPIGHVTAEIAPGRDIALRDSKNNILAIQRVDEVYAWDLEETAHNVFGKFDARHPIIAEIAPLGAASISRDGWKSCACRIIRIS